MKWFIAAIARAPQTMTNWRRERARFLWPGLVGPRFFRPFLFSGGLSPLLASFSLSRGRSFCAPSSIILCVLFCLTIHCICSFWCHFCVSGKVSVLDQEGYCEEKSYSEAKTVQEQRPQSYKQICFTFKSVRNEFCYSSKQTTRYAHMIVCCWLSATSVGQVDIKCSPRVWGCRGCFNQIVTQLVQGRHNGSVGLISSLEMVFESE